MDRKLTPKKKKAKKEKTVNSKEKKKKKKEKNKTSKSSEADKKKRKDKEKVKNSDESDHSSRSSSSEEGDENLDVEVAGKFYKAGVLKKAKADPKDYATRVLKSERPDLFQDEMTLRPEECKILDAYLCRKAEIRTNEIIVMKESLSDDDEEKNQDKLIIINKYAEGRFGAIYVVKRVNPDGVSAENAIFAMKTSLRQSHTSTDRLYREIRALMVIHDPNTKNGAPRRIIEMSHKGTVLGIPYFLMPPMSCTLAQLRQDLPNGKMCISCWYHTAQELLMGIQDIHIKNYVHRDIKPTNYLHRYGKFYLIDFGDACMNTMVEYVSPPDSLTLPFISLAGHKAGVSPFRALFSEDIESWFYTVIDLIKPLSWRQHEEEAETIAEKNNFWKNLAYNMKGYPPNIIKISELVYNGVQPSYKELTWMLEDGFKKTKVANHGRCWSFSNGKVEKK